MIENLHEKLKKGELSVRELVNSCLMTAKEKNKDVFAFLEIFEDLENDIKRAEQMFKENQATKLTGIPIAIKDNILIKGKTCSASSKIIENYKATYDATVIKKLKDAGAII